jgi:hypothetical protein
MLTQIRTANFDTLIEIVYNAANGTVITLALMDSSIHSKGSEIPLAILGILKEKEQFIREFMSRYSNWFNQDISHIMENELEDVLDEFKEIVDFKFELAPKVEALVETRDLLIEIHSLISERESLEESFSVDSLVKMINNTNVPLVSEAILKTLKSNFEVIQNRAAIVDITYPNHIKMLKDLDGYIWELDVKNLLSNKYNQHIPNQLYKAYRDCPAMNCGDELKKLGKKLKINPIEPKEVRKGILDWLNEKNNHRKSRKIIYKALIADTKGEEVLGQYIRLANEIMQNDHKLTETTAQQLVEFGFGNTKMFQRYLGKLTATKKQLEAENTEHTGVFREQEIPEELKIQQDVTRSHSNDAYSMIYGTGSCEKKDEKIKKSAQGTPDKEESMKLEEIPSNREEILETEELIVETTDPTPAEEVEDAQAMIEETIEPVQEEEIFTNVTIEGQEIRSNFEFFNFELPQLTIPEEVTPEPEQVIEEQMFEENISQPESIPQKVDDEIPVEPAVKDTTSEEAPQTQKEEIRPKPTQTISQKMLMDDAFKYYYEGRKPKHYAGTQKQFAECYELAQNIVGHALPTHDLELLSPIVHTIIASPILVEGADKWVTIEKRARALKIRLLQMTPEEVVQHRDEIEAEYKDIKDVRVLEVKKVLEEVERDRQTHQEINEAMLKREGLTLDELTVFKNRYKAAIYYKDTVLSHKVFDFFIMAVINSWKIHDHENGKTQIDYFTLKELFSVVQSDELNSRRYIKPDNADFIKKLYEKVRAYIKENMLALKADDMKEMSLEMSYMRFIDLTSKMTVHKTKANVEQKRKKRATEENRLSIALKTTGTRSKINCKMDYEHIHEKFYLVKPAFINKIDQEHRKYFLASIKYHLEGNNFMNLGHEGAYIAALTLEKDLFEKNLDRAVLYENNGLALVKILDQLKKLKYISIRIMKAYGVKYDSIIQFARLKDEDLKKWEANCNKKYHELKDQRQKREDSTINRSFNTSVADKDDANPEPMKLEKVTDTKTTPTNAPKVSKSKTFKLTKNRDIELMQSSLIKHSFDTYRIYEDDFTIGSSQKKTFKNVSLSDFRSY